MQLEMLTEAVRPVGNGAGWMRLPTGLSIIASHSDSDTPT